jgi:putative transposase
MQKEIERLPKILVMLYTCTFLVFLIEIHQKHYPDLSEGVMSLSVWKWVQHYKPERISFKRRKISKFIIDETQIKVGQDYFWIWVAIEPIDKVILGTYISLERNMLIAEEFLHSMINKYGKHPVSTDGGTWYPQACRFLKIKHRLHSSYEKSIIERTIQSIKDRTESFDDYFPCTKCKCKLQHIRNWFNLFVGCYNGGNP